MDLNLAGVWQPVFDISLSAEIILPKTSLPIPSFVIPFTFESHLTISATSTMAKPNWRLACHATLIAAVAGVGNAQVDRRYIPFGISLLMLQQNLVAFNLLIDLPQWQEQLSLKIWQQTT